MKLFYYILLFLFIGVAGKVTSQTNYWDMPTTKALIDGNKKIFSQNQKARDNQLQLHTSATLMKQQKDKCKRLLDSLEQRLNTVFIVVADVVAGLQTANVIADIYAYQSDALKLVIKHPDAGFFYVTNEKRIIDDVENLFNLITLVVISYGDISKMKVSERKIVYTHITGQLMYLRAKNAALVGLLKAYEVGDRGTKKFNFLNRDKEMVDKIIKDWKQ